MLQQIIVDFPFGFDLVSTISWESYLHAACLNDDQLLIIFSVHTI